MSWTPDRENLLRILWTQGLSAAQIAKRLGGVSRNAVIGKRIRMGLPERDGKAPRRDAKTWTIAAGTRVKAQYAKALGQTLPVLLGHIDRSRERGAERGETNVRFIDKRDWQCMMFVGGESHETGLICGQERLDGRPYCIACSAIAYLPAEAKRRAA